MEFLQNWLTVLVTAQGRYGLIWWSVVCLILYFYHRYRVAALSERNEELSSRLEDASCKLLGFEREFAIASDENQLLRTILLQPTARAAAEVVLRRYQPDEKHAFAVILETCQDEQRVLSARGVSEATAGKLEVPEALLQEINETPFLVFEGKRLQECDFFQQIPVEVRNSIRRLAFVASPQNRRPSLVLITSELLPAGGSTEQHRVLGCRVAEFLDRKYLHERDVEIQKNQLRLTSNMLQLRSISDRTDDSPHNTIREYLSRLVHLLDADRVALFLGALAEYSEQRVFRCGRELSAGIEPRWAQHEEHLAISVLGHTEPIALTTGDLEELGIDTLIGSAMMVPVLRDGRQVAQICCTRSHGRRFADADKTLLNWASEDLANVMYRLLRNFSVLQQAKQDGLTQLANRREFDEQIERACQHAEFEQRPVSLLLLDLDHFKRVNDNFGHQTGDSVLRKVSQILRSRMPELVRGNDEFLIARYGGEELAVLLPNVPENAALRIAESIRTEIESAEFTSGRTSIDLTVSIGVATLPNHADAADGLVTHADSALYSAKDAGRNQVVVATELSKSAVFAH